MQEFGVKYTREALEYSKQGLMGHSDGRVEDLNADRNADIKAQLGGFRGQQGLQGDWHLGRFTMRGKRGLGKRSVNVVS